VCDDVLVCVHVFKHACVNAGATMPWFLGSNITPEEGACRGWLQQGWDFCCMQRPLPTPALRAKLRSRRKGGAWAAANLACALKFTPVLPTIRAVCG
jgi:hypothetical protein